MAEKSFLRRNLLTILTVIGVFGGAILGIILQATSTERWTPREVMYLQFPGDMFLRMLKGLIIPLLFSSIVCAVGSLDLSLSKKIAMRSIMYYATTTVCAVALGIVLVLTIRPGVGARGLRVDSKKADQEPRLTTDTVLDLLRNLFPPNLIQAAIAQSQTKLVLPKGEMAYNVSNPESLPLERYSMKEHYEGTTNVLGLVVFGVILGISIGKLKERGKVLLTFFEVLSESMMMITGWVIWISPVGVFFLVSAKVIETESFGEMIGKLGLYFATVMLGLFIHGFGTISVIFFVCTRTLPFRTLMGLGQVLVTAFGTASSSATMPLTIATLDEMGLDPRVTRFVIPVGSTINMDGTALYEAVAAIFIAQFRNISMSFGKVIAVSVTATAASIGAAGIPQAGLVTMVMVLDAVGLPADDATLIIAVDWLLDRFRTTINVIGDTMGAKLVDVMSKKDLQRINDGDRKNADPHELVEMSKTETHI